MAEETLTVETLATCFAPAGRDAPDEFVRRVEAVQRNVMLCESLDAMPGMVLILNGRRQILGANKAGLAMLHAEAPQQVLARRPGEAVGCIYSADGPDGCGTGRHCIACGAVQAILDCLEHDRQVTRECRILTGEAHTVAPLDLRVTATPIRVSGERMVILAVEDISQSKRLEVIQRVFFHDVLNTAGCISGYAYYLGQQQDGNAEVSQLLMRLSDQLIDDIKAQRELLAAESNDYEMQVDMIPTRLFLEELREQFLKSPAALERNIEVQNSWSGILWTDRRLLLRVLSNMLKNALEAVSSGQAVTLCCLDRGDQVAFAVNNPGVMSENVQLQIFQRSFSTKSQTGRGIGTYSMKLFAERYLKGRIEFVSCQPEGTTFILTIPKSIRS